MLLSLCCLWWWVYISCCVLGKNNIRCFGFFLSSSERFGCLYLYSDLFKGVRYGFLCQFYSRLSYSLFHIESMLNDSMYIQTKLKLRHCADFPNLPKGFWVDMESCYALTESTRRETTSWLSRWNPHVVRINREWLKFRKVVPFMKLSWNHWKVVCIKLYR